MRVQEMSSSVRLAFQTAYLITTSVPQAESAVLKALDRFDPDRDSKEALLRYVIGAALRQPSSQPQSNQSLDPVELRAVLALPDVLRRCFVLRFLVRLSPSACARQLHLSGAAVNDYTCAALQLLAGVDPAGCSPRCEAKGATEARPELRSTRKLETS
jgi:hypothetical protein